jgi:hypothetical protein
MHSPYPGMDPYLEDHGIWPDFHTTLYVELKKSLNRILPPGYMAKIDRYVWIHEEGNRYLNILDAKNHRVVTVLEILSPANKNAGIDREACLMKRNEYYATGMNVIEIDLLRSGQRMPWGEQHPPRGDYYVMICRASEFPKAGIWSLSVREPLPTIPIPLDQGIPEPHLALKECFDNAFEDSRHETEIDYSLPPTPPLEEPDATWVRELLARGK